MRRRPSIGRRCPARHPRYV